MHFDIQRMEELLNGYQDDNEFGSHCGLKKLVGNTEIDIIVGGPPCQAYSIAGRVQDKNYIMKKLVKNLHFINIMYWHLINKVIQFLHIYIKMV